MTIHSTLRVASCVLLLIAFPSVTRGQSIEQQQRLERLQPKPDLTAAEVMELVRAHRAFSQALPILLQLSAEPQSQAVRDEIADTLASIAISLYDSTAESAQTRLAAIYTLAAAGGGGSGGVVYPGAIDRLYRIAERALSPGTRTVALLSLTGVADRPRALALLRTMAISHNIAASSAVLALGRDGGADALAVLHDLYFNDLITDRRAYVELNGIVNAQGWKPEYLRRLDVKANPTAIDVALLLRKNGTAGQAVAALRQMSGAQPPATLNEMGDTLVYIAITHGESIAATAQARRAVVTALARAGAGEGGGVPYAGAPDRLAFIAKAVMDSSIKADAALALARMADRTRALDLLRTMAMSRNSAATAAVAVLGRQSGAEGLAVLRELYLKELVTQEAARIDLNSIATRQGWKRDP